MIERRVPCRACGALIVSGAKKCRACKTWLVTAAPAEKPGSPVGPRVAIVLGSALATVLTVLMSSRESPVGDAPPLTNLATGSATTGPKAPAPGGIGPEPEVEKKPSFSSDPARAWRVRQLRIGDVRPLALVFHPNGGSVYVTCDDATLREYRVSRPPAPPNGAPDASAEAAGAEVLHQAQMPAQGDEVRLLFDRYVAALRHTDNSRIPVMDTKSWDRDPQLLDTGPSPGDILGLPDGHTVIASAIENRRLMRFDLPSGERLADLTLPHTTGQMFLVRAEGRPYVAAVGALSHAGRHAGSWIDVFDPNEIPFGATRRSIPIGREVGAGDVSSDASSLLFPDRVSNAATLLKVASATDAMEVAVGQSPSMAFFLHQGRHGVVLNGASKTASVIDLATMHVVETLMLDGVPHSGAVSPDGRTLFVTMGGDTYPPAGASVTVISGDPPRVVASLATGRGATKVAVSRDGTRAAIACWWDRSITVLEQEAPPPAPEK